MKYYKLLKNDKLVGIVATDKCDRLKDLSHFYKIEILKKEYEQLNKTLYDKKN